MQTAYRVCVASSLELLRARKPDLWDSGKVATSQTAQIEYAGSPLRSRQTCYWSVQSWDRDGTPSPPSEPARWQMGLLQPGDWSASWIDASPSPAPITILEAHYYTPGGAVSKDVTRAVAKLAANGSVFTASNESLGGDPALNTAKRLHIRYELNGTTLEKDAAENTGVELSGARLPYLRKTFNVDRPIKNARLYATALGVYELRLNAQRVGDRHLAPGWTDYRNRVRYQVYDVTDKLRQGENAIGALVAPGWFCGHAGLFNAFRFYGESPALLAQLEITYDDDSVQRIVSDTSWKAHEGPVLSADILKGESYDANAEAPGWDAPGLDDAAWRPVQVREEHRTLQSDIDEPIRVLAEMPAKTLSEPAPGRWTFDLAQNMVGVVRLRVRAPKGTVLTLRHAEVLNADGTIYTANLRGADSTDTYICNGSGIETWQPRFTIHGFRYVELTGPPDRPPLDAVTGIVLGSDVPKAGDFSCSDPLLNQLQSNISWGLRGNYVSIPTDCPQRDERMGWMADAQVFLPTATFNADLAAFMSKWTTDILDAQRADGAHSDAAPAMKGLSYGTPAWGDAGVVVPWLLYETYADTRILKRTVDSMVRWVQWCRANSTGLIRDHARGNDYGDWLAIGADTPKDLIGTAYFAHAADILSRTLKVLGRERESAEYEQLFEDIKAAFNKHFVRDDARISGDTQCGYVLALAFNLLPDTLREKAAQHLVADIQGRGWRLSTGFVGVSYLLPALADAGYPDLAHRLLMQDQMPSWLFAVKNGATTIWERWDGWTPEHGPHPDASMNSFNHYSLGSCGRWLFEGVAGISRDPGAPGFERIIIRPRPGPTLTEARATYRSVRGRISSEWTREDGRFSLHVVIPANTTATVYVPAGPGATLLESGRPVAEAEGVRVLRKTADAAVLAVGSGDYTFTSAPAASHSGNPILPGWYADPEPAAFDGCCWIYPTFSAPYDQQTFIDAFSSTDLVTWTKRAHVLSKDDVAWARRAMWAPAIVRRDGRYFLFFAANDIQSDDQVGGIGVAVAERPEGPFKDYLGKPLIDRFHNGAQPIDQAVFRDDDGVYYLIYGGWGHCNIARLGDDFRGLATLPDGSTHKEITPPGYVEGPCMLRRKGKYYFMWSEGGWTGPEYSVAYAIGDSPLGPFSRIGTILKQDPKIATGAGHHGVLRLPGTDEYYIVYHRRPLGETDANHRVVCIDRLEFGEDGFIKPVKMTFEGVERRPVSP